jgi:putative membrane protein
MRSIKAFFVFAMGMMACAILFPDTSFAQGKPTLTDPEIASVAVTANQIDINYAAIALKRTKDADVRNFATTMSNDHKAVIDAAVALVTKLHVTPKDNAVSKQLNDGSNKEKKTLEATPDKDFDKAYIANEVGYHKAVINAVETLLIPQSQNAELKALLEKVLPTLKTHLAHAEMVQKKYAK